MHAVSVLQPVASRGFPACSEYKSCSKRSKPLSSVQKRKREVWEPSPSLSLFFMWELEMYLQNCIGYGSRSAGVIITMRCWLGHGVHITFSSPGFPVRDAAAWLQSDSDTINVYPRRYSMSSAVLPLP